jgi:hypothetical protein
MSATRFDILFAGELMADADPDEVRLQLQQRLKLSEETATRLFSGRTLVLKRDVDVATASRYREIFRDAGALVETRPVPPQDASPQPPVESVATDPEGSPTGFEDGGLHLVSDAEQGKPLEQTDAGDRPDIDISHLRLVPGQDWTLEDCQPSPTSNQVPDTSRLKLVEPPPESREESED